MRSIWRGGLAAFILSLWPIEADARCQGAVMLGSLHDAYRTTLTEDGDGRRRGAMSLLFLVGDRNSAAFARQVERSGVAFSPRRLEEVLTDAAGLATATLEGTRSEDPAFRHGLNIQWLADVFMRSGCQGSPSTASRSGSHDDQGQLRDLTGVGRAFFAPDTSHSAIMLGTLGGAVVATLLFYKLYNSFTMRRRRTERLPRTAISLQLQAQYAFPDGEPRKVDVEAVDVSLGGMKLSWPQPPSIGSEVTLHISGEERVSHITWSNSFYAGVMFENQLTDEELSRLTSMEPPYREQKNGAENGAASSLT